MTAERPECFGDPGYRMGWGRCLDCKHKFDCVAGSPPPHDQEIVAVRKGVISVSMAQTRIDIRAAQMAERGIVNTSYLPGAIILGPGLTKPEDRSRIMSRSREPGRGRPYLYEKGGVGRIHVKGGRALCFPRDTPLTERQMKARLASIDIGQLSPLRIGQRIERAIGRGPRSGSRFSVTLGPGGFMADDLCFGGLSSALAWFLGTPRRISYLDLQKNHTRLYGPSGELIQ